MNQTRHGVKNMVFSPTKPIQDRLFNDRIKIIKAVEAIMKYYMLSTLMDRRAHIHNIEKKIVGAFNGAFPIYALY